MTATRSPSFPASPTLADRGDLFDAVAQLETTVNDGTGRNTERLATRCRVTLRAANASQRADRPIDCVSLDISNTGCRLAASVPFGVGDVYWIEFEKSELNLSGAFVRCLRCRFVREHAFEAGFAFFQPIDLSIPEADASLSLL